MKNIRRIYILILLGALLLTGGTKLCAQADVHMTNAYSLSHQGKVDSAKIEIDLCFLDTAFAKDPLALYIRGMVYNEYYKRYEMNNPNSPSRLIALDALEKSYKVSKDSSLNIGTLTKLRYIAGQFYNDAVATLDTVHYNTSIACYNQYRDIALFADPKMDIKTQDIKFYLALSSIYNTLYNSDKKKNAKCFDLERDTYLKILQLDANNYTANYNLGLLYWNKGVDLIYNVDYDDSLTDIFKVQDHSVELFKESLPFAQKAYEIEPKREETLIVLSGIYYSLNEFQRSDAYKKMLEDLRKQPH
jgi:hypothetical protein